MTLAKGCFGFLVREIQIGLLDKGFDIKVDSHFGPQTEEAVRKWQDRHGFIPNGRVTETVFTGITGTESPTLFECCFQLAAAFEGMSATRVVNHDGVGLGYGHLTFSLKWGHIRDILIYQMSMDPLTPKTAPCGEDRFRYLVNIETPHQEFYKEVMANKPDWVAYLSGLDTHDAQVEYTYDKIWSKMATKDHDKLVELGVEDSHRLWGMCFDHAVQSGGLNDDEIKTFLTLRHNTRLPVLVALANAMADHARAKYRDDVLSRRLVFAMGTGTVHGKNYLTVDWGIDRLSLEYAGTQGQETADVVRDSSLDQEGSGFFKEVMEMGEIMKSKTIWTGVIAVVSGVLAGLGVIPAPIGMDGLTPENQQLVQVITQIIGWALSLIGGLGIFQRLGTAKVEKKLKEIAGE